MSALQVLEKIRDEIDAFISGRTKKTEAVKTEAEKSEAVAAEVVETTVEEVAAEAPAATGTVPSNGQAKSRKGWKGGVNKSELVRDYFKKHGMECKNKDLIDAIRKSKGVELNPTLVSIIRKSMGSPKKTRKTRAQKVATKASRVRKSDLEGLPMTARCARIIQKTGGRDGLKLAEIADLVIQTGYKYTGSKGREGVVQNVYQALHSLMRKTSHPGYEGQVAVILKDETSHRYRLNPKAKAKKVA